MRVPDHRIRCLDRSAAADLAADMTANGWGCVGVAGDTVTFPSDNPAAVVAVAEYAIAHGLAHDADAAALIGSLG